MERIRKARAKVTQPQDAPLLTLESAGAYVGMTVGAVRKLLDGTCETPDAELRRVFRENLVDISPRRRFIRKEPLLNWLKSRGA